MSRPSIANHRPVVVSVLAALGTLAVLLPLWSVPASASGTMSAEAKALAKLDDEWSASAATKDAKKVSAFYAEDATAYPPNEPAAAGRAAAEKVWAAYFSAPEYRISWKTTHAEVNGSLGYTTGTFEGSHKGPDGKTVSEKGKYLCVWKKQGGTWKAIRDMWNSDTK